MFAFRTKLPFGSQLSEDAYRPLGWLVVGLDAQLSLGIVGFLVLIGVVDIVRYTRCHIGIRHQYLTADIAGIATCGVQVQRQVFSHGLQPLNGQLSI